MALVCTSELENRSNAKVLIITAAFEELNEDLDNQTQQDKVRVIRKPVSNGELLSEIKSTLDDTKK